MILFWPCDGVETKLCNHLTPNSEGKWSINWVFHALALAHWRINLVNILSYKQFQEQTHSFISICTIWLSSYKSLQIIDAPSPTLALESLSTNRLILKQTHFQRVQQSIIAVWVPSIGRFSVFESKNITDFDTFTQQMGHFDVKYSLNACERDWIEQSELISLQICTLSCLPGHQFRVIYGHANEGVCLERHVAFALWVLEQRMDTVRLWVCP